MTFDRQEVCKPTPLAVMNLKKPWEPSSGVERKREGDQNVAMLALHQC